MLRLIILLFFIPLVSHAQVAEKFGRIYNDTLPEDFKIDISEIRTSIHASIPEDLREQVYPKSTFRFADQASVQLSYLLTSGQVYRDWMPLENYVNEILKKVLPDELKEEPLIHVYLLKDGDFNAFMTPSGMIFINIGLLDAVESEAMLAGILTHELAHYYQKHSIKGYVKEEKGDFDSGFFLKENKDTRSRFSINNELEADSLAMIWLDEAGYDLSGISESHEATKRIRDNWLARHEYEWRVKETTHPSSEKRITNFEEYCEQHQGNKGAKFLVSKNRFFQFKEQVKPEILKHLLTNFEYDLCIEKAFKYHIFEPNNSVYVYYLMEAIRRNCYLTTDKWREKFITNRYYKIVRTKTGKRKEKTDVGLFDQIPYDFLNLSEKDSARIAAMFYWEGDVKFITNEQAFLFFNQIGELLEEPECVLSNALSLSFNKEKQDKLLEKYLTYENIAFREYAEMMLKRTIKSELPSKTLTVLSGFYTTIRQGGEEILIRNEDFEEDTSLKDILQQATAAYPNRQALFLPELQNFKLNTYTILKELELLSFITFYAKGEQTELHVVDPRYWQVMNQLGVNEIEFINLLYYDARKGHLSLELYKELINIKQRDLFSEVKRNRYLRLLITSIREIDGGTMKIKFIGEEEKLPYKNPGFEEMVSLMERKIASKDELAEDRDKTFRKRNEAAAKKQR